MKFLRHILIMLLIVPAVSLSAATPQTDTSTKKERNHIATGNKLYSQKKYEEAETEYRKALQANPASDVARFNIATTLLRRGAGAAEGEGEKILKEAEGLMRNIAEKSTDASLRQKAWYDLGNLAYKAQQYKEAVDYYKQSLRLNPDDEQARRNLRLAQKKLQEQQQNKDQNKNQDKQDQNKDQDKQDQNKDKDKDQKDKDQNKDQDKQDKQQPPEPKGGISDENARNILKAMENEENATQQRIKARQQQGQPGARSHGKPW